MFTTEQRQTRDIKILLWKNIIYLDLSAWYNILYCIHIILHGTYKSGTLLGYINKNNDELLNIISINHNIIGTYWALLNIIMSLFIRTLRYFEIRVNANNHNGVP